MELTGAWRYLLFFALDGAAGVCAVLLVRRAARAESSLAPRLAVWGLVAASSTFNWTHAPHRPAAAEAFGLMPVVAALLFEFCLRELRLRTLPAGPAARRAPGAGSTQPNASGSAPLAAHRQRLQPRPAAGLGRGPPWR